MYSKSLMPQSCSLGGAKTAAGQPALGKQVTGAGAEGQVPCPAQPIAPPSPSPDQHEAALSVSSQLCKKRPSGFRRALRARHRLFQCPCMEDGQRMLIFQPRLPVPGPSQEQHGCRHATTVLKLKGFMASRIMITLGKEMPL